MNDYNDTKANGKVPPYNTGKLVIGKYYEKPRPKTLSTEDEFWQGVLLGEYQRTVLLRRQMGLYLLFLVVLFSTLAMVLR